MLTAGDGRLAARGAIRPPARVGPYGSDAPPPFQVPNAGSGARAAGVFRVR